MGDAVALMLALSAAVARIVDFIRNAFDEDLRVKKWVWSASSIGVGVAVCVIFEVNGFAQILPARTNVQGVAAQVFTGLTIAGGSGLVHELMDLWSSTAKSRDPVIRRNRSPR